MNKTLLFFLLLTFNVSVGQDTIVKINNDKIIAKILEINSEEISYKKFDFLDGPQYRIPIKEVIQINYHNGFSEDFNRSIEKSKMTKSLDETKSFITSMINQYGWEKKSNTRRLKAEFDNNYLRLWVMKKNYKKPVNDGWTYDFSAATSFHPVSKRGGDVAYLNIWVPILHNKKRNSWKRSKLVIEMRNHDAAEQLRLALIHLRELTASTKQKVEQFK